MFQSLHIHIHTQYGMIQYGYFPLKMRLPFYKNMTHVLSLVVDARLYYGALELIPPI